MTGVSIYVLMCQWLTPTQPNDGRSRAGSARECVATKFTEEPRHGRTAQVSARNVDQRTRTVDHPTTAEWSTGIPRPCSKVQSAFAGTCLGTAARDHAV